MLRHHFLRLTLIALALFAASLPASAFDQTTRWYSIVVQYGSDTQPPLYLSNGSTGVTLERYRSGDVTQQWALMQPDYPTAPAVTGSGPNPLGAIYDCIVNKGCPFSGHATTGATLKIVNHASGGCLILQKSGAKTSECQSTGSTSDKQKWGSVYKTSELRDGNYTALGASSGAGSCLTADGARNKSPDFLRVGSGPCGRGGYSWPQLYTIQLAAELTCKTNWDWQICMVEGQGR
ncbi:MAG: hypothetical protein ABIQ30_03800 [Devosia sp.]